MTYLALKQIGTRYPFLTIWTAGAARRPHIGPAGVGRDRRARVVRRREPASGRDLGDYTAPERVPPRC